jgi:hypothetical protein
VISFRLLASIYGRPTTIFCTWDVELPADVDREYNTVDSSGRIVSENLPGASMFGLSVKLMRILHEILGTVYPSSRSRLDDKPGSRDAELLRQSLELNDQLDQLLALMPERLSSFVALPQSANHSRAFEISLHEQALITRSVPTISPRAESLSFASTKIKSPNNVKTPVC